MHPDRLFLERCEQIALLSESYREIDILDIGARLRALVLDKHSLVEVANINRLKLRFKVGKFLPLPPGTPEPMFMSLEDALDPFTCVGPSLNTELNYDDFLCHHIMNINGNKILIKHVIQASSNLMGGIHYDPRPDKDHQKLVELSKFIEIGGTPASIRILKAIGRVTLRGLEPLIVDVSRRLGQPPPA